VRLFPIETGSGGEPGARIGFGCASLGDLLDFSAKCKVIEAAYEAGFRHFDVAPSYAHGEGEAALATALAGVRDRVSIVTKAGIAHPKAAGTMKKLRRLASPIKALLPAAVWGAARRNASRLNAPEGRFNPEQIEASVTESLRRLQSDSIDALLLHEVITGDLAPDTLATLDGLVARGVVRALGTGTSMAETARIAETHGARFQAYQLNHYWGAWMPALATHGAIVITHRCIRTGLELLVAPAVRQQIAAHPEARALQAACADKRRAGSLMLMAAAQAELPGMVLVSSSKAERARQFVETIRGGEMAALGRALNECFDSLAKRPGATEAAIS